MKETILTKRKSGLLSVITCILFLAATAAGAVLAGFSEADGAAPWIGLCAAGIIALLCHSMVMRRGMPVLLLTAAECVFAVWKENLKEKGESVYAGYRSSCIKDLYSGQSEEENEEYIQSLPVEEKSGTINRIIKKLS